VILPSSGLRKYCNLSCLLVRPFVHVLVNMCDMSQCPRSCFCVRLSVLIVEEEGIEEIERRLPVHYLNTAMVHRLISSPSVLSAVRSDRSETSLSRSEQITVVFFSAAVFIARSLPINSLTHRRSQSHRCYVQTLGLSRTTAGTELRPNSITPTSPSRGVSGKSA